MAAKEIKLDNLKDLNIKKADWKEVIEKFITDAIKHDAQVLFEDDIIEIIDKTNKLDLCYTLYDQNIVVYAESGRPLGAYDITISYEVMLKLISED